MDKLQKLYVLVADINSSGQRFYGDKIVSRGTKTRTKLMDLIKICKECRVDILEKQKQK